MVNYLIPNKIAIYTKHVKKPRKHLPYQVIVHKQGNYPSVVESFKTKKEADKDAKRLIRILRGK